MTPEAFLERVTSIARLHDLRASAGRWLSASGIDDETIETVALVLSETCTNAFTHGRADGIDVEIAIDRTDGADGATVTVLTRHEDHDAASLAAPPMMPPPDALFGRGLALVERLVDGMTVSLDPPLVERRCWLRADGASRG